MATSQMMDLLSELHRLERLRDPAKRGQRTFQRFYVRGDAELHPMGPSRLDRTPIEIKLRDIGRGGVGFLAEQALPVGSSWQMAFLRRGYIIGEQAVVVRHCVEIRPGVFLIGAQFCIDTGLLTLLGVDPALVHEPEDSKTPPVAEDFVGPGEVG